MKKMGMKLEDFISETLIQIINGIKTAQKYADSNDAKVNPKNISITGKENLRLWDGGYNGLPVEEIKFDVAVSTTQGSVTKGGIGIFVGGIGVGTQGQSDSSNLSVSRIRFSVPVRLPAG